MRWLAAAAGLVGCLWVLTAGAAGQGPPDCDPANLVGATLTAEDGEGVEDRPPVRTHTIEAHAEVSGNVSRVRVTPPAGVRQIATSGTRTSLIAPNAPSVDITVSWRQPRDPATDPDADPDDPDTGCAASRVFPVALLDTLPSHAVKHKLWRQLVRSGVSDVGIVPALKRPDLSPLEITARTTSRVAFPRAGAKPRTMAVPMRDDDRVKYRKRLPNPAYMSVPQACRFYYIACATPFASGGAFVQVGRLLLDDRALNRGIEKGDVNGPLVLLPRSQPNRDSARYGILLEARPGGVRLGQPRPFGYDVQVRQSGRLIARVRQAGRCVERRLARGLFTQCRIARSSYQLH